MAYCRCDGTPLGNADHCAACGCEEYEESCGTAGTYDRHTGRTRPGDDWRDDYGRRLPRGTTGRGWRYRV